MRIEFNIILIWLVICNDNFTKGLVKLYRSMSPTKKWLMNEFQGPYSATLTLVVVITAVYGPLCIAALLSELVIQNQSLVVTWQLRWILYKTVTFTAVIAQLLLSIWQLHKNSDVIIRNQGWWKLQINSNFLFNTYLFLIMCLLYSLNYKIIINNLLFLKYFVMIPWKYNYNNIYLHK